MTSSTSFSSQAQSTGMPWFLSGCGEIGQLIADFDWSKTELGPIAGWSQTLTSTLALILHSPVAIVTLWGEDGIMIYNEAYSRFADARHPSLLGSKVLEGWPEAAELNDHVMKTVMKGGTLAYRDQELMLRRSGHEEQLWLNLDYSPILSETGKPVGVIAVVVEVTQKVKAEEWLRGEHERLRTMFEQAPGFVAMLRGPDHIFDLANPAYLELVGNRDVLGKGVREALPEIAGQGFFELLDDVYRTGTPFVGAAVPVDLRRSVDGATDRRYIDLVYQLITGADGSKLGVFAQGTDVTDRVTAQADLVASEMRNRQIIDSAVDYAIIAFDLDGKVMRWNKGAENIFGWTEMDMLGNDAERIFTLEDRASGRMHHEMNAALETGVGNDERWHLRKSGERFWASGEMTPILNADNQAIGFVKVLRDFTLAHRAAEALKQSELRLRRAQEAGGVGLFSVTLIDNLLQGTPEFHRIFGLDYTPTVSTTVLESLVLPEDRHLASSAETRFQRSAPLDVEYRIRRADTGEERVISRRAEFEFDPLGQPVRLVGAVRDVTDRRSAQQAIQDSEAKFRALAQTLPNLIWTASPTGEPDWFNERVYEYSGLQHGQLDGLGWANLVHPDDRPASYQRWQTAMAEQSVFETEYRLRRADGTYRWHLTRALPIFTDDGEIKQWLGTNTDIDELRSAREALSALNQTLEQKVTERTADRDRMWRLSTDVMLVADFHARIMAVNPAWTTIFGWNEDELIGRLFIDLLHPDDRQTTLDEVARLEDGYTTFRFENRFRCKDGGYRMMSWTAVPDEHFLHAVGRDVTAERDAAEALRVTEMALQQAQKMESIGNLTGGIAHDFNNLLQVVSGNLQLLVKDISGNERAMRRVENALSGVQRGAKLASQLLAFGRRQPLEPKTVNIGRFIYGMEDMLRHTIGEGIEVRTLVDDGLWNTLIDPAQIENAILNLAINARDAMEGFGTLTIEASNVTLDPSYALTEIDVKPGEYVQVSVTDTGSGMTPEVVEKVFEPFFSTKPVGKGTGLGLPMVYGFVKQSGGHVKIYSEAGHGTTVRLYLPRALAAEDTLQAVDESPIVGGTETILVAEDDDGVRATVVDTLRELGYQVLTARDPQSALSLVESGADIDLLFTDVVMPGTLKSADMAREVQALLPGIAVLFTSGFTENSIVHDGRLDEGIELLSKPYTREALARKIRMVLGNPEATAVPVDGPGNAPSPDVASEPLMASAVASVRSGQPLTVLVVEDDGIIRMDAAEFLTDYGHTVLEAESAEEAMALLQENSVDVLFTDLGLPGISGSEFARQVRDIQPEIGIVFATGKLDAPDIEGDGLQIVLRKPYGGREIEMALNAVHRVHR